jgi:hypothetical protein
MCIVAYWLKARIVESGGTAVAMERLCKYINCQAMAQ